ncbi:unnamed protein product [Ranitomeya imitator]|uniref:CRIB domain-containing protein n=1 Tax=Ranitomeya imitator TaxID=111125 RepID=A0ABN9M0I0_9NEOB|nr:unnamed protein product [Ranitomeya imitator]
MADPTAESPVPVDVPLTPMVLKVSANSEMLMFLVTDLCQNICLPEKNFMTLTVCVDESISDFTLGYCKESRSVQYIFLNIESLQWTAASISILTLASVVCVPIKRMRPTVATSILPALTVSAGRKAEHRCALLYGRRALTVSAGSIVQMTFSLCIGNVVTSIIDLLSGVSLPDSCCIGEQPQPRRRRIDRSMIGEPMNFVHTAHVGSGNSNAGFAMF